jgi:hypothetical protein
LSILITDGYPEGQKGYLNLLDYTQINALFSLLESISEPVVSYNDSLRICWMNPAAELFLGSSLERMRGMSCIDIFPDDRPCRNNCPVRKAFADWETVTLCTEGLAPGESLLTAVPILQDGESRRVLEIMQNTFIQVTKAPFKCGVLENVNGAFTISEAAPFFADAIQAVAGPVAAGVYIKTPEGYSLLEGRNTTPEMSFIPNLDMLSHSPLYVRFSSAFPGITGSNLPDEVSILPIFCDNEPRSLLLCGSVPEASGRERLEALQSILVKAMNRFLLAEAGGSNCD